MKKFFKLAVLQIGNFIAAYHFYIIVFITSSFLAQFVGVENVGYVFIVSAVFVALLMYASPPIFRSFGTRNVITVLALIEIAVLLGLAVTDSWIVAVVLVTVQTAVTNMLFIGIDFLIEASITQEAVTGSARTKYLAVANLAVLLGSLSLTFIIVGDQYWRAFVAAAIVLLPFLALSIWYLPRISYGVTAPSRASVLMAFRTNPSLRRITLAHLLMQMFFSWAGIYIPILLFAYEGFTWGEIGIITALAIVPYILIEYPAGIIADRWLGEKEFLIAGFAILSATLFTFAFLSGASFFVWAAVMVLSRVGAALIEAMTETHFFRHVNEKDTDAITFFRVLRPLGNILGPAVATLALMVFPLQTTFAVFGAIMLIGIPVSLSIIDSK